jgi:hypothetical protein
MKRLIIGLLLTCALFAQNPETAVFPGAVASDTDLLVAKDSAWSVLDGGIDASTLTVVVITGSHFVSPSTVKIGSEQLKVCSINTNTFTICTGGRGYAGTTAASHLPAALVEDIPTAKHHNLLAAEIKAVETALGASLVHPLNKGTTPPGACAVGDVFYDTDATAGQNLYGCTATDVWTLQPGGGSGASASRDLTDLLVTKTSGTALGVSAGTFGIDEGSYTPIAAVLTIQSFAITGISGANPGVITVSAGGLSGVVSNGDTVTIAGVTGTGCTAFNGTFTATLTSDTTLTVGVTGSGCTWSSGGTIAGAGNGTAYIYGNSSGTFTAEIPAASGVIAKWITGSGVVNQVTTPAFSADVVPLGSITLSSGAWSTVTDQRRFSSARSVTAGTGISVSGGAVSIDTATVPQLGGANTWTGANDFAAATVTGLIVKVAGYEVGGENAAAALVTADLTNHAFAVNDASAKVLTEASCVSDAGDQTVVVKVSSTTKLTIHCVAPASYSRSTTDGTTGYLNAAHITDTAIAVGAMLDLSGTANTTTKDLKLHIYGKVN